MDIEKQLGVIDVESWDEENLSLTIFNSKIKNSLFGLKDGEYYFIQVDFNEMTVEYMETENSDRLMFDFKVIPC